MQYQEEDMEKVRDLKTLNISIIIWERQITSLRV